MLESIYRATGLRVGLFTSPHLVCFSERIQVNRRPIEDHEVVRLVKELRPLIREFPTDHGPTFFEATTVMGLRYFQEQGCDLVIWETGLGGRLDSTNIVTPLASIITNINIEHTELLGDTVEKIAMEKAGIIKPDVPVITAARPGEGLEVITSVAREKRAPLTVVGDDDVFKSPLNRVELPLHGPHQRLNAATAAAAAQVLAGQIPVSEEAMADGLKDVAWPGRMQRITTPSGQILLLDGAHNPAGAEALRIAVEAEFPKSRPSVIFGVFRDKDFASMCRSLAPLAGRLFLVPVHSERSEDPARLRKFCHEANPGAAIEICGRLSEALERTAGDPFVLIAGSLYLVGEAMELLHLASIPPRDEKRLNEWKGNPRQV
jgi:dihydrofolate synthase/folylpolyglutamate synthase